MRKLTILLATLALALTALPASADKPTPFSFSKVLEYTNPCTGEVHDYLYTVEAVEHYHENNFVGVGTSTIETEDGYVGTGPDPILTTNRFFIAHSTYLLANDETGGLVRTQYIARVDLATGDVLLEREEWDCVRAPA